MVALFLSIPFMVLAVAVAVFPLVWGMRRQRSWEDVAIVPASYGTPKDFELAVASVLLGEPPADFIAAHAARNGRRRHPAYEFARAS